MLMTGAKVANVKTEYENQQSHVYQSMLMLSVLDAHRAIVYLSVYRIFIHSQLAFRI